MTARAPVAASILTRDVPPTCKSISNDAELLAVLVMFSLIALGVPDVFHVPAKSINEVAFVPVSE